MIKVDGVYLEMRGTIKTLKDDFIRVGIGVYKALEDCFDGDSEKANRVLDSIFENIKGQIITADVFKEEDINENPLTELLRKFSEDISRELKKSEKNYEDRKTQD